MAKIDQLNADQSSPASAAAAVDLTTTDATYTDPKIPTRIYVGGGAPGDVKVDMAGGGTVTFKLVPVGTVLPVAVTKIYKTGTTATDLVALFNQPI